MADAIKNTAAVVVIALQATSRHLAILVYANIELGFRGAMSADCRGENLPFFADGGAGSLYSA